MEGDGQVRGGGGELEGAAASDVAPQDTSRDLIAVGDGQHVAVTDVQPEDSERNRVREREREAEPEESAPDKFAMTQSESCRQPTVWETPRPQRLNAAFVLRPSV